MKHRPIIVSLPFVFGVFSVFGLVACDNDRGARKDLSNSQQEEVEGAADVWLFPDKYPNLVHRCDGSTGTWATTDRHVWIVYNDPECPDYNAERETIVLDNIPGATP